MKKALRLLFLCKDTLISLKTIKPISSPGEKMAWGHGPQYYYSSPVNGHQPPGYISPIASVDFLLRLVYILTLFNSVQCSIYQVCFPARAPRRIIGRERFSRNVIFQQNLIVFCQQIVRGASTKAVGQLPGGAP